VTRPAYYNEIDPYAAAWLRNLIAAGHIAPGVVDERSIEDVKPDDLRGFAQCHFFAGIGVWSLALRRAGWPDDRPVWTGSCPCQPFSAAGKGNGFADERHLWPAFFHLISQHQPAAVLGEQVASKDADAWIDLVHADMEALDYTFGAVPFPSAGVGAPHIRDRLYWVANADNGGWLGRRPSQARDGRDPARLELERFRDVSGLDHADHSRLEGLGRGHQAEGGRIGTIRPVATPGELGEQPGRAGATNGHWADADWLGCRDGKWRPVEPGTFPLAHGAPARVGRLRAYGNAINAEAARVFIEIVMECMP
jgi:DNA (cytosine-5)-methyltransferase 1